MDRNFSFGTWVKARRKALDLTQRELARHVACALGTIRKIEADQRRPSRKIAERLAAVLAVPGEEHGRFISVARGTVGAERLLPPRPEYAVTTSASVLPDLAARAGLDTPAPGPAPYKGLHAFDTGDAALFFGREAVTNALVARLRTHSFLAVVGASGTGKSSTIRAGLIPVLHAEDSLVPAGEPRWVMHLITPTEHPLEALALSLTRASESVTAAATLQDDLACDARSLHLAAQRLLGADYETGGDAAAGARHLLLVVDQFEELFTLCTSACERAAFVDNLLAAVALDTGGAMRVVITLRADFYAHCAPFPKLREALACDQVYIGPLTSVELRQAIEEPAQRGGWEFEPGLVEVILRDAGSEPGALPLLSHALLATWQRRRGRRLTLAGYAEAGGVTGGIARTADRIYQALAADERAIARRVFLQLTELGDGTQETRRRANMRDLIPYPSNALAIETVLNTLAHARLITLDQGTIEVAHEALIREWPTLREWLVEDRERLRLRRRLQAAAAEWAASAQDSSFLARGARLIQWEALLREIAEPLSPDEQFYLDSSIAERERQAHEERRQRDILAANLRRSEALRLAAEASTLLEAGGNAEVIALLAIRSLRTEYTPQGDMALAWVATLPYARLLFAGHTDAIWTIAVSRDGRYVLTGSNDRTARLWDAGTGRELRIFAAHTARVNGVAFSPDGHYALTGSADRTARLWDTATGTEIRTFTGHASEILGVAYAPDGASVLTCSNDRTARLWDVPTGTCLRVLAGHAGSVEAVAYAPDGHSLVTGSWDGTARLWEMPSGGHVRTFAGHRGSVTSIACAPDGASLLTGSEDATARLWEAHSGQERLVLMGHDDILNGVAYAPDGHAVVTGGQDRTARVWDVATGVELWRFAGHTGFIWAVAWTPNSQSVLTGSYDGTARLWSTVRETPVWQFTGHTDSVLGVAYSPDGKYVLTGSVDRTARLWDAKTGRELKVFTGHASHILGVAFSPDGRYVLTGSGDLTTQLWDAESGLELRRFEGHTNAPSINVAYAPDGRSILTGSWDKTARLWDVATGAELVIFIGHTGAVFQVAYAPDGLTILTGGYDKTARLWDARTGTALHVLALPDGASSVAYAPDGRTVVTGSWDGTVRLWDAETGCEVQRFVGHTDVVWGAAYTRDGRRVLTGSADKTARLWDVETGAEIRRFGGRKSIGPVAISPDGRSILVSSKEHYARQWQIDYNDTIRYLCGRLLRDFSNDERAQYSITDTEPTCPA